MANKVEKDLKDQDEAEREKPRRKEHERRTNTNNGYNGYDDAPSYGN
jgi:hypothetical protein